MTRWMDGQSFGIWTDGWTDQHLDRRAGPGQAAGRPQLQKPKFVCTHGAGQLAVRLAHWSMEIIDSGLPDRLHCFANEHNFCFRGMGPVLLPHMCIKLVTIGRDIDWNLSAAFLPQGAYQTSLALAA